MNRRTFLAAIPAATTLAGCTQTESTADGGRVASSPTASPTATRSPTPEPTTAEPTTAEPTTAPPTTEDETFDIPDHLAATDLANQPAKGPGPRSAPALIVTFSDPSCPVCAWFGENTVPKIETELVESGTATFINRTIPVIHDFGKPCVQAQEATYAHDPEAFWALTKFYYSQQRAFYEGTDVFSETRTFLAENTDVDAEKVVSEAEDEKYDDAVQTDLEAAEELDIPGTPTTFLFKEGEYVTMVKGGARYKLIETALDL